ncbi:MAG TPA: tetratricopeptide repeat protein [Verrucomicrobiae bacterium]|nr:tetratricopeptide repeat protein [Verrucomicrobiae bacterium]
MTPEIQKHIEYASGYLDLKMYDDAVREADLALALSANLPQAIAIKSAALWQSNRLTEAEPFVAKLAELNPRDSGIWINLAYIRRRTQSLDAAVDTLRRAFEANPKNALAHYNMACYRAMQHREGEAIEMLRNALCLDPKLKALARAEPDFTELRLSPAFQELLKSH